MRSMPKLMLLGTLLLLACEEGDGHHHDHHHAPGDEDASIEGDAAAFVGCPSSTPVFGPGMQATGNRSNITATLVTASSVPPQRYLNDWTIALSNQQGEPVSDVEVIEARPFMPVHGHDGNIKPNVEKLAAPGQLSIAGINLLMRGPWEVQLMLSSKSAGSDYVVFHVCVEE